MSRTGDAFEITPSAREEHVFSDYLRKERQEINEQILFEISQYSVDELMGPGLRELFGKGKRLRGAVLMLSYSIFSEDDRKARKAIELAAAIEIAHTTSIVLDDMIDGDERRRGQRAVHMTEGQRQTILGMVGSLSIPYSIVARHGQEYTRQLAETHRAMVAGEMAQIHKSKYVSLRDMYEEVIAKKTGQLFSLAARFGGMAAGCRSTTIELLSSFGMLVGKAVQQADDIRDLETGVGGTLQGSELLLAHLVHGDVNGGGDARKRTIPMLGERIEEANLMVDKLVENRDDRIVDAGLLSCLRSAPREMAMMMLEGSRPLENVMFGRPLKRPK